jgi:hypothetical protein
MARGCWYNIAMSANIHDSGYKKLFSNHTILLMVNGE